MLEKRPKIEQALQGILSRENYLIKRNPSEHAGGKLRIQYVNYLGILFKLWGGMKVIHFFPKRPLIIVSAKCGHGNDDQGPRKIVSKWNLNKINHWGYTYGKCHVKTYLIAFC